VTPCVVGVNDGFVASRNQNIYTSIIASGLVVGSLGNSKPLGFVVPATTPPQLLQRAFEITLRNTSTLQRSFRITIGNQPALAARGAWGAIFRVDIDADASEGTISLFVLGDKDHAAFDNLTFADRDTLIACEDRGDTLHKQLNTLDSCWAYSVTGDLNPRRFLALGRDDAALKDADFTDAATAGFQNSGDNEPTGFFVSNGKQSSEDGAEGMYGTGRNLKGARWFFTRRKTNPLPILTQCLCSLPAAVHGPRRRRTTD